MASQAKHTSRWGSLLQQAVAGVESRLDTILADDDGVSVSSGKHSGSVANQPEKNDFTTAKLDTKNNGGISRQSSASKKNDRLQERLAKAVVSRNSAASSTIRSRTGSPRRASSSARSSLDNRPEQPSLHSRSAIEDRDVTESNLDRNPNPSENVSNSPELENSSNAMHSRSMFPQGMQPSPLSTDLLPSVPTDNAMTMESSSVSQFEHGKSLGQALTEYKIIEHRRQEEAHQYLEHIDALQAKLQYLTREAAELAKNTARESDAGSNVQKLAQKDEKIALLLEEGQKLSQNEMKHLTTIKKLRVKSLEDEKSLIQARREAADGDKAARILREKLAQAENTRKEDLERLKHLERECKELERVKSEMASMTSELTELQGQIARHESHGFAEEVTKYRKLLETEKKTVLNLQDELANAKVEKELCDGRHRARLHEIQGQADRDRERARVTERDLKAEMQVMESRFETYRARAEEVSSGGAGDVQAKLTRQIEMLQSSYSVANENWKGIENSLLARITRLEKERDDLSKKENDLRRKARDAVSKHQQLENQQEGTVQKLHELETNLAQEKTNSSTLQDALHRAKADAESAQSEFELTTRGLEARLERLEAEHAAEPVLVHSRGRSPVLKSSTDRASPRDRRPQATSGLGLTGTPLPFLDRPVSRRISGQASIHSSLPHYQHTATSITLNSGRDSVPETPSIQPENQDDLFDGVVTPATPEKTINDMFSVSTAGAGPSVQLVERMSAAVRGLESEKATLREELDRLAVQRDEAREQVVTLMREVEDKRAIDTKANLLEAEAEEVRRKLDTTLEMLGEKSELVEELRADIVDMREIFHSTLENTVK